jgi:hypothetical protein
MAAPLYNAEIAPPELRGSLVGLQQLANVFGLMVSFWIDYGMLEVVLALSVMCCFRLCLI